MKKYSAKNSKAGSNPVEATGIHLSWLGPMLSLGDHAGQSVEKFKAKIQEITKRSHNLDEQLIARLNQVIRGTANYFATPFSHNRKLFTVVDKWIRMRCMKFKRKWKTDNRRFRLKYFRRMGLLSLQDFYPQLA